MEQTTLFQMLLIENKEDFPNSKVEYIKLGSKFFVYNTQTLVIYNYEPKFGGVLFSSDPELFPFFDENYGGLYDELSKVEFEELTKNDPRPKAYFLDGTYYICGYKTTAMFNKERLMWEETPFYVDKEKATEMPVDDVLNETYRMQLDDWEEYKKQKGSFEKK